MTVVDLQCCDTTSDIARVGSKEVTWVCLPSATAMGKYLFVKDQKIRLLNGGSAEVLVFGCCRREMHLSWASLMHL